MTIREMTISDYDPCSALWRDTPGIRLTKADSRKAIASFLLRNPGMSLVCVEDDELIGTAMSGHDGRRGYLYHVVVKPEYRGGHIGTRLVEGCLERLGHEGIDKCHVFVLAGNALGNAFWASIFRKREDIIIYSQDVDI